MTNRTAQQVEITIGGSRMFLTETIYGGMLVERVLEDKVFFGHKIPSDESYILHESLKGGVVNDVGEYKTLPELLKAIAIAK